MSTGAGLESQTNWDYLISSFQLPQYVIFSISPNLEKLMNYQLSKTNPKTQKNDQSPPGIRIMFGPLIPQRYFAGDYGPSIFVWSLTISRVKWWLSFHWKAPMPDGLIMLWKVLLKNTAHRNI